MSEALQRTLRAILAGTPGLLALKNKDLAYEVANPRFCQFLGKALPDIMNKRDADLFPAEEAAVSGKEEQAVLQAGMPRKLEQGLSGSEGSRWFEVTRSPILDAEGDPGGVLMVAYDITELKKRQAAVLEGSTKIAALEQQAKEATENATKAIQERDAVATKLSEIESRIGELEEAATQAQARVAEAESAASAQQAAAAQATGKLQAELARLQSALEASEASKAKAIALLQEAAQKLQG